MVPSWPAGGAVDEAKDPEGSKPALWGSLSLSRVLLLCSEHLNAPKEGGFQQPSLAF